MDNLGTLCLIAIIIGAAALLIPRLLRGFGGQDYSQRGSEMPHHDDPDIQSRGAFGRPAGRFGRTSNPPSQSSGSQKRHDDPNIQSRGSFGRTKNDD